MRSQLAGKWIWIVLTLPALAIAVQGVTSEDPHIVHNLLEPSGEASARLLIIALCATPLSLLLPGWRGPRFLVRNRRAIGVAAFAYACLHLLLYIGSLDGMAALLAQLGWTYILLGWVAFVLMVPLAATSTNRAAQWLGRNWKRLHRLAYLAAAATFLHWLAIYGLSMTTNVVLNFSPILLLAAVRFWRKWRGAQPRSDLSR